MLAAAQNKRQGGSKEPLCVAVTVTVKANKRYHRNERKASDTLALYAPSIALATTRRYNCIIDAKAVGGEGANSEPCRYRQRQDVIGGRKHGLRKNRESNI